MEWLALGGALFLVWLVLVFLFTPGINYHLSERTSVHHDDFLYTIQSTCQAALHRGNGIEILTNGASFYPAMIDAIRSAQHSINMECYIFQSGRIADQFIEALTERARQGVNVTIVVDAIGSLNLWGRPVARLREAGCRIESYQRVRWYSRHRINNRTHRELLVVDGRVAFVGGAGVGDQWAFAEGHRKRPWRDTMARIEGPVVAALQGVAAENWLECCGEILTGPAYFPHLEPRGNATAFVVKSSPSDRATASRVAFQLLMEGADELVRIATPYFLPDRALRRALVRLARDGIAVSVIVPDRRTDQRWVRLVSRRMWGELLRAGVRIYEYRGMTHAKVLIVDGLWSVLGTTNIDNRSFEHNDEVNLAICDADVAARLLQDYDRDLAGSDEVTLERWQRRPWWEKVLEPFVWILERQQ
jgi:cardiolipin synthase